MEENKLMNYLDAVLKNMPNDWLELTTHRLDIYEEKLAKSQFLEKFEDLFNQNISDSSSLNSLPTAYDYIRLGHPLSCVLEWSLAKVQGLDPNKVISFSSKTIPALAILRKNLLKNKKTLICYSDKLPSCFDVDVIRMVYGYQFDVMKVETIEEVPEFDGTTVFISSENQMGQIHLSSNVDFFIQLYLDLGSVLIVNGHLNQEYISEIQHVRRRETISMTPSNCHLAIKSLIEKSTLEESKLGLDENKASVLNTIDEITGSHTNALVGSSGLSIQYAIMMGLIHDAIENHPGKQIKIIVPPNCYGGTNDQARRVAACLDHVDVVDLPVDGDHDMVQSIDLVLNQIALDDAVPYIIAEIPTNPRVEVPNLLKLEETL
ncbi:MAG: cystathionine beta-synthase, partial [Flavobacteriales bacterium]